MKLSAKLLLMLIGLMCLPARAADYYILGVQDYVKNPILVVRDYQGLANYLAKILKNPVRIEAVKTYDEYIKKAGNKRFHFMFAPPSMIMKAHLTAGYEPVVKIPGLLSASFMTTCVPWAMSTSSFAALDRASACETSGKSSGVLSSRVRSDTIARTRAPGGIGRKASSTIGRMSAGERLAVAAPVPITLVSTFISNPSDQPARDGGQADARCRASRDTPTKQ